MEHYKEDEMEVGVSTVEEEEEGADLGLTNQP
jgi:hypothetical protein